MPFLTKVDFFAFDFSKKRRFLLGAISNMLPAVLSKSDSEKEKTQAKQIASRLVTSLRHEIDADCQQAIRNILLLIVHQEQYFEEKSNWLILASA